MRLHSDSISGEKQQTGLLPKLDKCVRAFVCVDLGKKEEGRKNNCTVIYSINLYRCDKKKDKNAIASKFESSLFKNSSDHAVPPIAL